MHDKIKPIIDSTYPALMAGLCLTFLAISQIQNKVLIILISTASFSFVSSSFYTLVYSVYTVWGRKADDNKSTKDANLLSWKIVKYSFFVGICLLLISTFIVVCDLWLSDLIQSLLSNLSGLPPIIETNSTNMTLNITLTNQT